NTDRFRLISEWYHLAIHGLLKLKQFKPCSKFISSKLKDKISPAVAELALERLVRVGLVSKNSDGVFKLTHKNILVDNLVNKSEAIQSYHKGTIGLALQSIEEPIDQRDLRSSCMAIKAKDFIKLKQKIAALHHEIHEMSCDE